MSGRAIEALFWHLARARDRPGMRRCLLRLVAEGDSETIARIFDGIAARDLDRALALAEAPPAFRAETLRAHARR